MWCFQGAQRFDIIPVAVYKLLIFSKTPFESSILDLISLARILEQFDGGVGILRGKEEPRRL